MDIRQASREELLDALRAVREAIDIPYAATVGDEEIRNRILIMRVVHASIMLAGILEKDRIRDVPWSVAYLREQLAKHPAEGYKTWQQRVAELAARAERS